MDWKHPATGHINTSTVDNMQSGNAYIFRRSQERPAKPEWKNPNNQNKGKENRVKVVPIK